MQRLALLHPLLVAAAPVLFLYAQNAGQVDAGPVWLVLAAALVLAGAVWGAAALVVRDAPRAACLASLALACFFLYGHCYELVWNLVYELAWTAHRFLRQRYLHALLVTLWTVGFAHCATLIVRTRRDLRQLSQAVTVAATVMIVFSLVRIASQERVDVAIATPVTANPGSSSKDRVSLPDIYYIILDGYARADVLERDYGFDNAKFLDSLRSKGFYVAERSTANYPRTFLSLASSLNMRYLDQQMAYKRSELPFFRMIRDSHVGRTLRSQGYEYIHFATHWGGTECCYIADRTYNPFPLIPAGAFVDAIKETTVLRLLAGLSDWRSPAKVHLFTLDRLREVPSIEGPTFAFAHLIAPHPPFVFDRDGKMLADLDQRSRQSYVDQLVFVNRKIEELVEHIQARSATPPIIIVQADHGPGFFPIGKGGLSREDDEQSFRERVPILNAYLVPDSLRRKLYPTITPVNTFRLLLSACFDEDYELLADRNFSSWNSNPFQLDEITPHVPEGVPAVSSLFPPSP